jgi:SnoaL-like domain
VFSSDEIADRLEIQHRINLYCHALDNGDLDRLDDVFLPDARMDFTCLGLAPLTWSEMRERLKAGRPAPFDQHIYANSYITFSDDRATATVLSKVYNPQGMPGPDGQVHFYDNHGEYHDQWRRIDAGWRICDRLWRQKFYSGDYPFPGAMPRAAQYELVDAAQAKAP